MCPCPSTNVVFHLGFQTENPKNGTKTSAIVMVNCLCAWVVPGHHKRSKHSKCSSYASVQIEIKQIIRDSELVCHGKTLWFKSIVIIIVKSMNNYWAQTANRIQNKGQWLSFGWNCNRCYHCETSLFIYLSCCHVTWRPSALENNNYIRNWSKSTKNTNSLNILLVRAGLFSMVLQNLSCIICALISSNVMPGCGISKQNHLNPAEQ